MPAGIVYRLYAQGTVYEFGGGGARFLVMESYPLRMDDVPAVIAGLETLAQEMRSQPSAHADATRLLAEQAGRVDELADRLRA
jgi:hypothetical protein